MISKHAQTILREAIAAARQYGDGYKVISVQFEVYNKED